jgi:hypothetical protein
MQLCLYGGIHLYLCIVHEGMFFGPQSVFNSGFLPVKNKRKQEYTLQLVCSCLK